MTATGRSWTDAITNAALFADFDTVEYLRWLTHRKANVWRVLPQFLHEFTHHWCFDSLVGSAIALTTLRARRAAIVSGAGAASDAIQRDLCRCRSVEAMLQPLSEGLALFAEFDITPGPASSQSQTTSSAIICFGFAMQSPKGELETSDLVVRGLLQELRRRSDVLERKAGVYALPFEVKHGYLAGYMAIKSLWAYLAARVPAFEDRDLYLCYLRSYVYADAELVRIILQDGETDFDACQQISRRIHERLVSLLTDEHLPQRVAGFDQACATGGSIDKWIGISSESAELAASQTMELVLDEPLREAPSPFAVHALMTVQERQYVCLGYIAATATSSEGRAVVSAVDADDIRYECNSGLPDGAFEGEIIVVSPSRAHCVAVFFVVEKSSHLLASFGDLSGVDLEELDRYLVNRKTSTEVHEVLEASLAKALEQPELGLAVSTIQAVARRHSARLYGHLATLHADEHAVDSALELLHQGGLFALLDGDAELVRAIAAIGLANTAGTDIATVSLFAQVMGLSSDVVQRAIDTLTKPHGMRVLRKGSEYGGALALV